MVSSLSFFQSMLIPQSRHDGIMTVSSKCNSLDQFFFSESTLPISYFHSFISFRYTVPCKRVFINMSSDSQSVRVTLNVITLNKTSQPFPFYMAYFSFSRTLSIKFVSLKFKRVKSVQTNDGQKSKPKTRDLASPQSKMKIRVAETQRLESECK